MAKTYEIVIDGKTCTAEHGEYLWDVAKRNGIEIPALCRSEASPSTAQAAACVLWKWSRMAAQRWSLPACTP